MEEEAGVYHGMPNNLEEDAASGVPIPDIFILGALIIQCTTNGSTMYGVCVYTNISPDWMVFCGSFYNECHCNIVICIMLWGRMVRFGGGWHGVV